MLISFNVNQCGFIGDFLLGETDEEAEGLKDILCDGDKEGLNDGLGDPTTILHKSVHSVTLSENATEGEIDLDIEGLTLFEADGLLDGDFEDDMDGLTLGDRLGETETLVDGLTLGETEGLADGLPEDEKEPPSFTENDEAIIAPNSLFAHVTAPVDPPTANAL